MCGVTKMDRIRNNIRMKVGEISKKVQERRLKWYGHVMRKDEHYAGKRMLSMDVEGKRGKGRPNRRWMDSANVDLREKGLSGEERQNRVVRRHLVTHTT